VKCGAWIGAEIFGNEGVVKATRCDEMTDCSYARKFVLNVIVRRTWRYQHEPLIVREPNDSHLSAGLYAKKTEGKLRDPKILGDSLEAWHARRIVGNVAL
jgi:hypothetical protein